MDKQYLGDGVYVEVNEEDELVLTAQSNTIYLKPEVYVELFRYVEGDRLD